MKTPWLLLLCVATLHFSATAQSILTATNASAPAGGKQIQESRLPATDAMLHADEQHVQHQSLLLSGDGFRWEAPQAESLPSVSLRGRPFPVSGFLVNPFAPASRDGEPLTWSERLFPVNKSSLFVTGPATPRKRALEYFKWGERDEPWDVVLERSRRAPEGVLFSLHF